MITICFIVFAIVLCYLIYNFNVDTQDQKQFDDMSQTITVDEDNDNSNDNENNGITDLINKNSDCIGWLRIDFCCIFKIHLSFRIVHRLIRSFGIWVYFTITDAFKTSDSFKS